jgi:hypothetical protein
LASSEREGVLNSERNVSNWRWKTNMILLVDEKLERQLQPGEVNPATFLPFYPNVNNRNNENGGYFQ